MTVDDISGENIKESQRYQSRYSGPEESSYYDYKVEIGSLLFHIQSVVRYLPVHCLLQDGALLITERISTAATAFKEEEMAPYCSEVEDDEVGKEGRDVTVPNGGKVGIKGEVGN
jgi:hypothetical protein